jgi:hypothetical protein
LNYTVTVGVAQQTVARMLDKVSRLYKQNVAPSRMGTYVQRWARGVRAGLGGMKVETDRESPYGMHDCMTCPQARAFHNPNYPATSPKNDSAAFGQEKRFLTPFLHTYIWDFSLHQRTVDHLANSLVLVINRNRNAELGYASLLQPAGLHTTDDERKV